MMRHDRLYDALLELESIAPVDVPPPLRRGDGRPLIVAAGLVAAAAVVAGLLIGNGVLNLPVGQATPSPNGTHAPTPSSSAVTTAGPTAAASPTATEEPPPPSPTPSGDPPATAAPTAPSADLAWTRTATFPPSGGLSMVTEVAPIGDGYVAMGVEYDRGLPVFGPTPEHHAHAWSTRDGRSWERVDLGPGFENVTIQSLIQREDGSLLALGVRGTPTEFGISDFAPAAWTTSDGVAWHEIEPPLVGSVSALEQGARGVLAVVKSSAASGRHDFWLSADGEAWEHVHSLEADYVDIGAGDEGFVAVGRIGGLEGTPLAIASADGRSWIEAATPPFGQFLEVAALGPDWVVVDDPGGNAATWFSPNGLDWRAHGEVPFRTVDEGRCREYRSQLTSADPWLVITTALTYPCSESGFVVHGTQYVSVDGASWLGIPLTEGVVGESRSGSSVSAALATQGGLILVGEENGAAAFWFGEAR